MKYKEVFPLFHEGKIWLGAAPIKGNWFYVPLQNVTHETKSIKKADDGSGRIMKQVRTARWFTNMDHKKKHKPYDLCETYSPVIYPVFDNFPDAINVNRREEIPLDYDGVMGVPTTFMDVFCPEQFEIVGLLTAPKCEEYRKKHDKQPFARILIRNLNPEIEASV